MQDLGTLPGSGSASEAYGINTAGQVVGWSDTATSGDPIPHAFLYSDGVMHDLNNLVQNLPAGEVLANRLWDQRPGPDHRPTAVMATPTS